MTGLRLLACLVLLLLQAGSVQAHRFAPSLLKVTEVAPQQYAMVWKTPAQGTSNVPLQPLWPDSCEITQSSPAQLEGTGKVSSWQMRCSLLSRPFYRPTWQPGTRPAPCWSWVRMKGTPGFHPCSIVQPVPNPDSFPMAGAPSCFGAANFQKAFTWDWSVFYPTVIPRPWI